MESSMNYFVIYVAVAYLLLNAPLLPRALKKYGLAVLNIVFTFLCFFYVPGQVEWELFLACIALTLSFYLWLRFYISTSSHVAYLVALLAPIAVLIAVKSGHLPAIIGFSYLAFRLTYLTYEVETGKITAPSLSQYLGFAFFPLIFLIGPISPYRFYASSLDHPDRNITPLSRSLARILVGMIKCFFLAILFKTLSFPALWLDGYSHGINDFLIACICSYFYIYFNFSGACDMIIGAAGVLNIRVKENFNNPFFARNLTDFWNRTHITLSHFMRDLFFTPGLMFLSRITGPRWMSLNIVVMTLLTFFLIGIWHGTSTSFAILGLLHGGGMVAYYLFSLAWRRLPAHIQRYSDTTAMRTISTVITFLYVGFTCLFFLNDWETAKTILGRFQF